MCTWRSIAFEYQPTYLFFFLGCKEKKSWFWQSKQKGISFKVCGVLKEAWRTSLGRRSWVACQAVDLFWHSWLKQMNFVSLSVLYYAQESKSWERESGWLSVGHVPSPWQWQPWEAGLAEAASSYLFGFPSAIQAHEFYQDFVLCGKMIIQGEIRVLLGSGNEG